MRLSDLVPDNRNANKGTAKGQKAIVNSLRNSGAGRSIVVDRNGRIIGGNKTAEAVAEVFGADVEIKVIETNGQQLIVHKRNDLDLSDSDPNNPARKLAYADNLTSWASFDLDPAQVMADIEAGFDFEAIDISLPDLGELLQKTTEDILAGNMLEVEKGAQPNPRNLPIDLIYTLQMADCTCCLAVQAGLKYGIQSSHYRLCPYTHELSDRHEVQFIDNDYFNYEHLKHVEAVKNIKPKYCTTRDLMTKEQCLKAGIEYYSFEQVMEQAAELEQYAENVIIIPKYDCLDKIPERYVLGYSVPTSHGGTPLPVKAFKGRRVHLLGGSWKAQLEHMAELGDDVVSVDNNYVQNQSQYGSFVYPDGMSGQVRESLGLTNLNNVRYVSLAISFGNMASKINELYKPAEPENHPV